MCPQPVCDRRVPSLRCLFFHDAVTAETYTLSLHDALPISKSSGWPGRSWRRARIRARVSSCARASTSALRSEEHTSELQSPYDLVCRLLLEKKKNRDTAPSAADRHPCLREALAGYSLCLTV